MFIVYILIMFKYSNNRLFIISISVKIDQFCLHLRTFTPSAPICSLGLIYIEPFFFSHFPYVQSIYHMDDLLIVPTFKTLSIFDVEISR